MHRVLEGLLEGRLGSDPPKRGFKACRDGSACAPPPLWLRDSGQGGGWGGGAKQGRRTPTNKGHCNAKHSVATATKPRGHLIIRSRKKFGRLTSSKKKRWRNRAIILAPSGRRWCRQLSCFSYCRSLYALAFDVSKLVPAARAGSTCAFHSAPMPCVNRHWIDLVTLLTHLTRSSSSRERQ
jgi:hypothetical protein